MLMIDYTKTFRKDFQKCKKRGLDVSLIESVLEMIINDKPLPSRYRNHILSGNYSGCRECHIKPDWIMIYRIDFERNMVILLRTGTHSDLFD